MLSLAEDVLAVGISYGALQHPMVALAVAVVLLIVIVLCASMIIRFVRRRFQRMRTAYSSSEGSSM